MRDIGCSGRHNWPSESTKVPSTNGKRQKCYLWSLFIFADKNAISMKRLDTIQTIAATTGSDNEKQPKRAIILGRGAEAVAGAFNSVRKMTCA